MKSWSKVLNLVCKIKSDYEEKFKQLRYGEQIIYIDTVSKKITCLEYWIHELDNDMYKDWISQLEINQEGNLLLIRYGALQDLSEDIWSKYDGIYRECRSIVIDVKRECIVLAPFDKFFNLGETVDNQTDNIKRKIASAKLLEITDKLDGSMQSARWTTGKVIMSGSRSLNKEQSWRLADGYSMLTENHLNMLKRFNHLTFIFEYISLKDAHVVNYIKDQEGLYLIGMRDVNSGYEFSYKAVCKMAAVYNIKSTILESLTFDELLMKMSNIKANEKEGWVLNIDGHRIKIKGDDYVELHKMLDYVSSINVIIKNIANETFDDLISKIPDKYLTRVKAIAKLVTDYKIATEKCIRDYINKIPDGSRKEQMIWIDANVPKKFNGWVKNEYLGQKYAILYKHPLAHRRYARMDEICEDKELLKNILGEG